METMPAMPMTPNPSPIVAPLLNVPSATTAVMPVSQATALTRCDFADDVLSSLLVFSAVFIMMCSSQISERLMLPGDQKLSDRHHKLWQARIRSANRKAHRRFGPPRACVPPPGRPRRQKKRRSHFGYGAFLFSAGVSRTTFLFFKSPLSEFSHRLSMC